MTTKWQTVRVFISSTFRDMHAERDWLVKRVFPKLRERLEKHRIHLVDIDLRWGITEEESQRDRVLDLCLQQIDDCRPFFVGILGERYGWVPGTFSEEAVSKYGWVQHHTGKSVTELEILYGVLRNPKMHPHSLFLFRDPAFDAKVPEAIRTGLMAEDKESAGKLQTLKRAIRKANLPIPLLKNYPCKYAGLRINWRLARMELNEADQRALKVVAEDGIVDVAEYAGLDTHLKAIVEQHGVVHLDGLETFGHHIEEQLWQAIKAEHNLPDTPPVETAEDIDPLAAEQDYHERFMESRLQVYVGRENVQERLTNFANGEDTHPCLVTGTSGSGKSAAMAKFATEYAEQHPDVLVIPHFVGASPGSTNLRQMLRRFCLILNDRFGLAEDVPQDVSELVGRFRQSLESVPEDARIVLVLDALNQLDETDNAQSMYWLPLKLLSRFKIVVSCIDDPNCTEPVLEALSNRSLERVTIELLTDHERQEIVRRVPSLSAKTLDRRQVELLLSNPATRNPLFLLVALEELRGFGSFEQLEARIAAFPYEGDDPVAALFGQVIERLREEFDLDVVRTVLALIACSRSGMSQRELLEMIEGPEVEESTSDVFPVLRQLRPYLQSRGELVDFFHRGLYKAVRRRYLPDEDDTVAYHGDLANYFHQKLNPPGVEAWSGKYPRALSELPYHQTHGQLWDGIEATLTSLPFLEAKTQAGQVFELAGDFSAAVAALPEDRPQRRIVRLLEEALRRDIHFIARHAEDYPQILFQCLWNNGWWYDCDEAAAHYETGRPPGLRSPADGRWAGGEGGQQGTGSERNEVPVPFAAGPKLCRLLERWHESKEHALPGFVWLRSQRPPPVHLDTAQKAVLRGHGGTVNSVALSPGGDRIVSGSTDETVRVWDAQSGAELAVLRGHESDVQSVAFSPDGNRIVSGGGSTVRVWDAASGAELAVLRGHEHIVNSVAFSPGGDRIASGSCDNTVRVWNAQSGAELAVLRGHGNFVSSVAFSPDGQRIVSGSFDNTVRAWDTQSGTELVVLRGHENYVNSVAFSPGGDRIVSGSNDKIVRVWDARSGAVLAVLRGHESDVQSVAFSPDGNRIVSGSGGDNTVRVWDAQSGAKLAVLRGHKSYVWSVAFSTSGDRIVSGGDNTVRVWDAQSGAELAVLRGHESHENFVLSVAFSPRGDRIVSGSGGDNTVRVWDAQSGAELAVLRGHEGWVQSVAFSTDGNRIVSGSNDKTVRVWDAQSDAELAILRHESCVWSVAFSPSGDRIVSGSGNVMGIIVGESCDNTVRVWDSQSGAELSILRGHRNSVQSVAFSPGGNCIVSGASDWDGTMVWDAKTGECLETIQGLGDVAAIAAGAECKLPWRALARGQETVIEQAGGGDQVARFPIGLRHITTHPNGCTWAGLGGNHVYIITLEGEVQQGDMPSSVHLPHEPKQEHEERDDVPSGLALPGLSEGELQYGQREGGFDESLDPHEAQHRSVQAGKPSVESTSPGELPFPVNVDVARARRNAATKQTDEYTSISEEEWDNGHIILTAAGLIVLALAFVLYFYFLFR